tara:strand:+ start:275 stop:433 length:159 start_codon:yes stop_codon:yes gene_type:complete
MSSTFWIIVGIVSIVFFSWLIYEAWTAPVMPDDYDTPWEKDNKNLDSKNENN